MAELTNNSKQAGVPHEFILFMDEATVTSPQYFWKDILRLRGIDLGVSGWSTCQMCQQIHPVLNQGMILMKQFILESETSRGRGRDPAALTSPQYH